MHLLWTSMSGGARTPHLDSPQPVTWFPATYNAADQRLRPGLWNPTGRARLSCTVIIGARAAWSHGTAHGFAALLAAWCVANQFPEAAFTDGLIFMAIATAAARQESTLAGGRWLQGMLICRARGAGAHRPTASGRYPRPP